MSGGSEFHAAGPACEKERSPTMGVAKTIHFVRAQKLVKLPVRSSVNPPDILLLNSIFDAGTRNLLHRPAAHHYQKSITGLIGLGLNCHN